MAKVFGKGIYQARRIDGVLHIVAEGQKPYIQTKVSLEQLPFHIWPPEFGLFFETDGIVSPVVIPFEIEKAFASFPKNPTFVRIRDASGVHAVDIVNVPASTSHPLAGDPTEANYLVYRQIDTDHYLIAKTDQIVPAIFTKVFGPDTLAKCQQYIHDHTFRGDVNLVPGSMNAWINRFPGPDAHPKLIVTVDAFIEVDWTVTLVRAEPQGINPTILLLKPRVELPPGPAHSHAIIRKTLRYEEEADVGSFVSVTILDGQDTMSAPVKVAE